MVSEDPGSVETVGGAATVSKDPQIPILMQA
jgi:hypothetical protein